MADSLIALTNIPTRSLPEMTKFFVILESAMINTSFVSMFLPFQFLLFYLYFIILYWLTQQIFYEFFITYFSTCQPTETELRYDATKRMDGMGKDSALYQLMARNDYFREWKEKNPRIDCPATEHAINPWNYPRTYGIIQITTAKLGGKNYGIYKSA